MALSRYLDDGGVPILKDVLMRLSTQRASEIAELLPHHRVPR
jgi:hypothetical protein